MRYAALNLELLSGAGRLIVPWRAFGWIEMRDRVLCSDPFRYLQDIHRLAKLRWSFVATLLVRQPAILRKAVYCHPI